MPDAGRSNLGVNGRGPDVNFFPLNYDVQNYPYKYREWGRTENHIPEHYDILAQNFNPNTTGYGGAIDFYLDKRGDIVRKLELVIQRNPVTGVTQPAFFNDFEAFSSIDKIEFYYSNKIFHTIYGEELMLNYLERCPESERTIIAHSQAGLMTNEERALNAQRGFTWICDLKVPFEQLWTAMPMIAMPNQILVHLTLKPLSACMNYAGGTPACSLVRAVLRSHYVHVPQWRRIWLFNTVNTDKGVALKYGANELQRREIVPVGTNGKWTLLLRNIKNAVYVLRVALRYTPQVDNPGGNLLNLWNFQGGTRTYVEDSGSPVTIRFEWNTPQKADGNYQYGSTDVFRQYNIWQDQSRCYPHGVVGTMIALIPMTDDQFVQPSEWDCYGSRQFLKYNNPQLAIDFEPPATLAAGSTWNGTPYPIYCDVWARIHNLLIYQKGDIRKYLQ